MGIIPYVVAVIIAIGIYVANRYLYGYVITPDGRFYEAMRAGSVVPRPYALRVIARYVARWDLVNIISLIAITGGIVWTMRSADIERQIAAAVAVVTLPTFRRFAYWPVLVDAPMIAVATIAAVAPAGIGVCIAIIGGLIIHERTPSLALATALVVQPQSAFAYLVAMIIAAVIQWIRSRRLPAHPLEQQIEWLRNPVRTAITTHAKALGTVEFIAPLGTLLAALAAPWWPLLAVLAISYAPLIAAQDRARIIAAGAVPMALLAAPIVPHELLFLFAFGNLFITIKSP